MSRFQWAYQLNIFVRSIQSTFGGEPEYIHKVWEQLTNQTQTQYANYCKWIEKLEFQLSRLPRFVSADPNEYSAWKDTLNKAVAAKLPCKDLPLIEAESAFIWSHFDVFAEKKDIKNLVAKLLQFTMLIRCFVFASQILYIYLNL